MSLSLPCPPIVAAPTLPGGGGSTSPGIIDPPAPPGGGGASGGSGIIIANPIVFKGAATLVSASADVAAPIEAMSVGDAIDFTSAAWSAGDIVTLSPLTGGGERVEVSRSGAVVAKFDLVSPATLLNFQLKPDKTGHLEIAYSSNASVDIAEFLAERTSLDALSSGFAVAGAARCAAAALGTLAADANVASLAIQGAASAGTVAASTTLSASLSLAANQTLAIAAGADLTLAGSADISGRLGGAGGVAMDGFALIEAGAVLGMSTWDLEDAQVRTFAAETYAGAFDDSHSMLTLAAAGLTLKGAAALDSADILGSGVLMTEGTTQLTGANIVDPSGGWTNAGAVSQSGSLELDSAFANAATGAYTLLAGASIDSSTGATFQNAGTLTSSGGADIEVGLNNNGKVKIKSGSLEIEDAVTGNGIFSLGGTAGAALVLDGAVAAGETVNFRSGGATLTLNDAGDFAGAIHGFGSGDVIRMAGADIARIQFVAASGSRTSGWLDVFETGAASSPSFEIRLSGTNLPGNLSIAGGSIAHI